MNYEIVSVNDFDFEILTTYPGDEIILTRNGEGVKTIYHPRHHNQPICWFFDNTSQEEVKDGKAYVEIEFTTADLGIPDHLAIEYAIEQFVNNLMVSKSRAILLDLLQGKIQSQEIHDETNQLRQELIKSIY